METLTIRKDAREAILSILNNALKVEYGIILNYPRMIDKISEVDKINDEILNRDIEIVGKDSFRHSGLVGQIVTALGGEPVYGVEVVARLVDVDAMLKEQLEREKTAKTMYQEAKRLAEKNVVKAKVGGFWNMLKGDKEENPVDVNWVISTLERIILDETNHVRKVEDCVATLKALGDK
ncbi:ferritin-like domain-containing protein [Chloroflexota bacterium]